MNEIIKIAVQKNGRLSEKTLDLLQKSGFRIDGSSRLLTGRCENFPLELLFLRVKDIPEIVSEGVADLGICGQDVIAESMFSNLQEIERLGFQKCRLSLAGPKDLDSLDGKRIATSFPAILDQYLEKERINAQIVEISGSVEIAPSLKIADLICDIVSTGSTLKMNGLEEIKTIFKSEVVVISADKVISKKQVIIDGFLMRIRATIQAQKSKYIVMNAPRSSLNKIQKLVPGLDAPTISDLANPEMISISSVVKEDQFWETIEKLKECGAKGILVLPIEKMIK